MADPGTLLVAAEVGACAGTVAPVWGPADPEGATVSGTVTELETDGPASEAGLGSGGGLTATSCSTFRGTSRVWAGGGGTLRGRGRSEEHTSELQSLTNLVCRLLLEKKKKRSVKMCSGNMIASALGTIQYETHDC